MYKYIHTYLFTCWFLLYQNFPTSNLIEERSIFHLNKVETFFECNILTYTNYICRCWAADRNFFCRPDLHYAESIKGCVLAADLIDDIRCFLVLNRSHDITNLSDVKNYWLQTIIYRPLQYDNSWKLQKYLLWWNSCAEA